MSEERQQETDALLPTDPGYVCRGWAESDLEHRAHIDAEARQAEEGA